MLRHCWLGDRKGIHCVKMSASVPVGKAVNVSVWGIAQCTL